jgi:hypothetical protein
MVQWKNFFNSESFSNVLKIIDKNSINDFIMNIMEDYEEEDPYFIENTYIEHGFYIFYSNNNGNDDFNFVVISDENSCYLIYNYKYKLIITHCGKEIIKFVQYMLKKPVKCEEYEKSILFHKIFRFYPPFNINKALDIYFYPMMNDKKFNISLLRALSDIENR